MIINNKQYSEYNKNTKSDRWLIRNLMLIALPMSYSCDRQLLMIAN